MTRMRFVLLFFAVVGIWLVVNANDNARQEISAFGSRLFGGGENARSEYNWGDVAKKVGEFAEEEKSLKEIVKPAP